MPDHIDSHYARTLTEPADYPELDGRVDTSVCVIGGGLAGIAVALDLAERGQDVVLLEARRIGWGASGRNGGFASPGFPAGVPALVRRVGLDAAKELMALAMAGHDLLRQRIARHRIACGPIQNGALRCAMADAPETLEATIAQLHRDFGLDYEYWPQEKLRHHLATRQYRDAWLNPYNFSVHPLNLTRGLARAARETGARIHEASKVVRTVLTGPRKQVHTPHGVVHADQIVFACGGYIDGLQPQIGGATIPIATFVMVTEPLGDRLAQAIAVPYAISDHKTATNYYRPLADTRLLWGGRVLAWEPSAKAIGRRLHRDMAEFYPGLANAKVETAWGGKMPYLSHRMPVVAQLSPGVWTSTGFGGLGVSMTTTAGRMLAAAIAENDDRHRLLGRFGLPYAGGHLGRVPAQLVYWRHAVGAAIGRRKAA